MQFKLRKVLSLFRAEDDDGTINSALNYRLSSGMVFVVFPPKRNFAKNEFLPETGMNAKIHVHIHEFSRGLGDTLYIVPLEKICLVQTLLHALA